MLLKKDAEKFGKDPKAKFKVKVNNQHELIKMPKKIKKNLVIKITWDTIRTLVVTGTAYSMQVCNFGIKHEIAILTTVALIVYLLRDTIRSVIGIKQEQIVADLESGIVAYLTNNVAEAVNLIINKVYKLNDDGIYELQQTAKIKENLKGYVQNVWKYFEGLPAVIIQLVVNIAMVFSIIATLDFNIKFTVGLIICVGVQVRKYFEKRKLNKPYYEQRRKIRNEMISLDFDLTRIKAVIKREFRFRVKKIRVKALENVDLSKVYNIAVSKKNIFGEVIKVLFLIWIVYEKSNFKISAESLTEIMAIITVYLSLLDNISMFLKDLESLKRITDEIEESSEDVAEILKVYDREKAKENTLIDAVFAQMTIEEFTFSYPAQKSNYQLINEEKIIIYPGDVVEIQGESGCGKTTALKLITGELLMENNPVHVMVDGQEKVGYVSTVFQDAEPLLGSQNILNEVTFGAECDEEKIIHILKGVCLYDDILSYIVCEDKSTLTDTDVIHYLKSNNADEFSRGQKQRLFLLKNLYNLDSSQRIIVFDEATGALDEVNARMVFEFIVTYIKAIDDGKIIFLISHQPKLLKGLTNRCMVFDVSQKPISKIIFN